MAWAGKEAVLKLREVDPNAVILVSSGYSDDPVMAEYVKYGFNGFIVKPYKPQDLIATIKKTVAAQPPSRGLIFKYKIADPPTGKSTGIFFW